MKYQSLMGMHDLLPQDCAKWRTLEDYFMGLAWKYGYGEIRTPIMEDLNLFVKGVGESSDIVSKEMFTLKKEGRHYVLRPENTASVVRAYLNHTLNQQRIRKLCYWGAMFRAETPQQGRYRQFHQCGIELFDGDPLFIDVEAISFLKHFLEPLGLSYTLYINSLGTSMSRQNYRNALKTYFSDYYQRLSGLSQKRLKTNPLRILDSKEPEDRALILQCPTIDDYWDDESKEEFDMLKDYLKQKSIAFEHNVRMVRGLDYYSKTIFEVCDNSDKSQNAIAGGGRYDGLSKQLGGLNFAAVGWALGIERLILVMEKQSSPWFDTKLKKSITIYIALSAEKDRDWFIRKRHLFKNQKTMTFAYSLKQKSLKSQFREANAMKVDYTLIVNVNEGLGFKLRDMKEGKEEGLGMDDVKTLAKKIREKINTSSSK